MVFITDNMELVPAYNGDKVGVKRKEFSRKPGIYFIFKNKELIYVGNSRYCVYKACYRHFQKFSSPNSFIDRENCHVVIKVLNLKDVLKFEKENIMFYRPEMNRKIYNCYVKKSVKIIENDNQYPF